MKVFIALLATETNTFVAAPTVLQDFEEYGVFHGDASIKDPEGPGGALLRTYRNLAEAAGHEVVESLCAIAQPSGRTSASVYESFREEILSDLRAAMPVDAVMVTLHGAMVAEKVDDCEGDLLAHIRQVVGPDVAVGVELDLHCHFTEKMREMADIIICFKEYPHIDGMERAEEVFRLTMATREGRIQPCTSVVDCKMIGLWHTTSEPMISFVKEMQALEGKDGVLSVSFGHGFPWGDVADVGAKVWVITDNKPELGNSVARRLADKIWEFREITAGKEIDSRKAVRKVLKSTEGPVVLADVADNAGGGAPGDSTFLLEDLLLYQVPDVVVGCFYDPVAVGICERVGVGGKFKLRIGGKVSSSSGSPVDLEVTVMSIQKDHSQGFAGTRSQLGTAVWVRAERDLDIVLCTIRSQVFSPDAFTGLGIPVENRRAIVVKSTQHFHAGFKDLGKEILYVSTPGAICPDFANIAYSVRDNNYWPRVPSPN